jgi:hypothetical protein
VDSGAETSIFCLTFNNFTQFGGCSVTFLVLPSSNRKIDAMRKKLLLLTAFGILGLVAVLSFSKNEPAVSQFSSPKCAKNCSKAKKPVPAATGFFIVDSYQGVL